MKLAKKILPVLCLAIALALTSPSRAEDEHTNNKFLNTISDSTNRIMKVTDSGLNPPELKLERAGGSVFFLNDTSGSAINVAVDYGQKPGYCATGKTEMGSDGILKTRTSFSPRTFVTICFPNAGTYPLKVTGLKKKGKDLTLEGTVTVE